MSTKRITSPHELRDELADIAERAQVGGATEESHPDEATHSVPNEEVGYGPKEILAEMMAGAYSHGVCIEFYGLRLFNSSLDDGMPNVWTVYRPGESNGVDAVNVDNFRSASELETYLLEGE